MGRGHYKQVIDLIAHDIRSGRLRPGTRLPTHRDLARQHGLALATASRAYAELQAMGLVVGETGRGTFVRDTSYPREMDIDLRIETGRQVDLNFNYPSVPGQTMQLREALRGIAASGDLEPALHYYPHAGRTHEREIVARHLLRRQLRVEAAQVALVDGAQHGLAVTLMALLRPGEVVAVDALTYPGFRVLAEMLGLELVPLPMANHETDAEALAALCRRRKVRAVYLIPTVHNPLGSVLGEAVRERLVAVARRYDLLVIEDGAYAYLDKSPPLPLAARAPERTVYVSSLSKSVATGLRFGFVAAPSAFITRIERAIRATTSNTAGLITALACRWIEDGTVDALEAQKRKDARSRQAAARKALAGLPVVGHPSSYLLWLPLGEDHRAERVAAALAREGISVATAEPFATTRHVPQALRLALGSVDIDTLRRALAVVKEVVELDALEG